MNSTLITALIGLVGVVLGSSTAFAALSPASRRLKRLTQLVELRQSIEDEGTRFRVDYATERLAHQIAEDVVMGGDRISARGLITRWFGIIAGSGMAVAVAVTHSDARDTNWFDVLQVIGGIAFAFVCYVSLLLQFLRSPQEAATTVNSALFQRRRDQLTQPTHAEGSAEGDVPAP